MKKEKENLATSETLETQQVEAPQNDTNESGGKTPSAETYAPTLPIKPTKLKDRRWFPYVITTVVFAVITLLIAWAEGGYTLTETWLLIGAWADAISISGAIGLAVGILVWASNGGAFDIFAYGGRVFIHKFKKNVIDRKYRTYYDYREARKSKKRSFWYLMIIGGAFLSVGIILFIFYGQLMPHTV